LMFYFLSANAWQHTKYADTTLNDELLLLDG